MGVAPRPRVERLTGVLHVLQVSSGSGNIRRFELVGLPYPRTFAVGEASRFRPYGLWLHGQGRPLMLDTQVARLYRKLRMLGAVLAAGQQLDYLAVQSCDLAVAYADPQVDRQRVVIQARLWVKSVIGDWSFQVLAALPVQHMPDIIQQAARIDTIVEAASRGE